MSEHKPTTGRDGGITDFDDLILLWAQDDPALRAEREAREAREAVREALETAVSHILRIVERLKAVEAVVGAALAREVVLGWYQRGEASLDELNEADEKLNIAFRNYEAVKRDA
ncbi:MAG: hypothetical protein C4551_02400 [Bacillota bacterium]|nr:MAG: hypothetical protein C4551_02400 [Bacillota bacterium]